MLFENTDTYDNTDQTVNVLYLSDNNYIVYLGVSITSLFINNKSIQALAVYVIDDNIAADNKEILNSIAQKYERNIIFLDMSEGIEKLKELGVPLYKGSFTTYLKLFAFALLPNTVHRILFIDTDSIVAGDISGIGCIDMAGKPVSAVMDNLCAPDKKCLGFSLEEPWFNMGVMLVDVDLWKKMDCEQMIIEEMKKRCAYVAADQNLLNISLYKQISILDPAFNVTQHFQIYSYKHFMRVFPQKDFYSEDVMKHAREYPIICHFERFIGEYPWHKNNVTFYSDLFDQYLSMTPWKDYEKKPADVSIVLKIEKVIYKLLPHNLFLFIYAAAVNIHMKQLNKMLLKGIDNISV